MYTLLVETTFKTLNYDTTQRLTGYCPLRSKRVSNLVGDRVGFIKGQSSRLKRSRQNTTQERMHGTVRTANHKLRHKTIPEKRDTTLPLTIL